MGACISSNASVTQQTANVVSPSGELHRFETPVTVSEVLLHLSHISSSSHSNKDFFLANSDNIAYDEQIPAMSSDEELRAGIYFVFPDSSRNRYLSASEMAALAVKASLALEQRSKFNKNMNKIKNNNKNKIIPFVEHEQEQRSNEVDYYYNYATVRSGGFGFTRKEAVTGGLARSGSLRKLHRYSSKKAKLAVRSFRLKLGTIHEGSVAHFF